VTIDRFMQGYKIVGLGSGHVNYVILLMKDRELWTWGRPLQTVLIPISRGFSRDVHKTIKFSYQEFRTMAFLAGKINCVVNMLKVTYDFMDVPRSSLIGI